MKIEKQIESGENRYRTGEESLISRLRKKLLDSTEWYKKLGNREREEEEKLEKETEHFKNRAWKNWREKKKRRNRKSRVRLEEKIKEKIEEGKDTEIKGVLFVPHTLKSELAKRIRKKLGDLENISCLRIKVVERAGEKVVDVLHKSNPWDDTSCMREDCLFCYGNNEKMIGKCKQRGVVYETLCMICERKKKKEEDKIVGSEITVEEKTGEKRKRDSLIEDIMKEKNKKENEKREIQTKYIGETSRSGYERIKEHMSDYLNLRKKSHILKHYLECHKDEIGMEKMEMSVRIIRRYKTSFERQIGESVVIHHNLGIGTKLLNSKNEYNRCSIPRLKVSDRDEIGRNRGATERKKIEKRNREAKRKTW